MRKVISIALFGEGDKYAQYLPAFVRAHHNLFPAREGWELRVHVDDRVSDLLISYAKADLIEIMLMGKAPLTKAMLWRMAPVFDTDVDFVFCRDLDAIPMPRDRACCEEFISVAPSRKLGVHTIHDNLFHEGIMGGLCGYYTPVLREVTGWNSLGDLYAAAGNVNYEQHGVDQLVLNRLLLKAGGPRLFEHRFAGWHKGPGKHSSRKAGSYPCAGVSSPVPDSLPPKPIEGANWADLLGNHLGCAGYDIEAAIKFWDEEGDPAITAAIKACEVQP